MCVCVVCGRVFVCRRGCAVRAPACSLHCPAALASSERRQLNAKKIEGEFLRLHEKNSPATKEIEEEDKELQLDFDGLQAFCDEVKGTRPRHVACPQGRSPSSLPHHAPRPPLSQLNIPLDSSLIYIVLHSCKVRGAGSESLRARGCACGLPGG